MPNIDPSTLRRIHAAAMKLGLAPDRDALLVGLDSVLIGQLPRASTQTAQILTDLHALSAAGTLIDGSVPLVEWLKTAYHLTASRPEAAIFEEVLASLEAPTPRQDGAQSQLAFDGDTVGVPDLPPPAPPPTAPFEDDPEPPSSRGDTMSTPSGKPPTILHPFGDGDVAAEINILPDLYFVDTDFSRKALSDKVNLIIGRRGAGKSALAHWLGFTREAHARHYGVHVDVSNLALFAPAVTALAEKLKAENHGTETLSSAWRLALLHALMVETLKDKHLTARVGSFEMDAHLKGLSIPQAQTPSHVILRVFQLIANLTPSISTTASVVNKVQHIEASPGFVAWRRALPDFLKASKQRAVIVIDTLEECRVRDQAMQLFMASLSHAVSVLSKGGAGEGVEIKLFLPAEVAQSLEDTAILNIGKTFDRALFMHWRRKDLLRLMCWRLMYHLTKKHPAYCPSGLGRYRDLDWADHSAIAKHVWDRFFPVRRTGDQPIDAFAHISRFTQLRPRQFVLLCNAIAQKAYENGTFPEIRWEDVGAGIADVVDTLAREVLSSYRVVYSDADRIVRTLVNAREQQWLYLGMTYGNVDSIATQAKGLCTNEEFWRLLLETGVLGVVTRDTDLYTEARFEYIVRQRLIPNVNDRFVVHPMFYSLLGIRPPRDAKRVFPVGPEDLTVEF